MHIEERLYQALESGHVNSVVGIIKENLIHCSKSVTRDWVIGRATTLDGPPMNQRYTGAALKTAKLALEQVKI